MSATEEKVEFEDIDESAMLSRPEPSEAPLTELRKLRLAEGTLIAILLVFVVSILIVCFVPSKESNLVFDTCRQILPPIVTLILGYYFSRK